ncbi:TATA box-binding protein-associated factor RNA polymerase I subunit C [Arapaima gigas]
MKEIMKTKQVLVHGITSLPPQEVLPTPDPVDIECWGNDLSQRLSMSWDGRWKNWWEEKLGLNLDKKIEELWRKLSSISASQRKPFVGPSLGSTPSRPTKKRSRMGF